MEVLEKAGARELLEKEKKKKIIFRPGHQVFGGKGNGKGFIMQYASTSLGQEERWEGWQGPMTDYLTRVRDQKINSRLVEEDYISGEDQNCN